LYIYSKHYFQTSIPSIVHKEAGNSHSQLVL